MAIKKVPKPVTTNDAAVAAFIGGAPDAEAGGEGKNEPRKGVRKGKRVQISHTISDDLLARVDAMASELGMSRAALLNMAALQLLERGAVIDGRPRNTEG